MPKAEFSQPLVPLFAVIINGSPLKAAELAYVTSIAVDEAVDLPGMATIELSGADTLGKRLPWVNDARFDIGHAIEIKLGYGGRLERLFAGEITGLEPKYTANGVPSLLVRGFDRLHRLLRGRKSRTFVKQKDSEIVSKVVQDAGLTAEATDSRVTYEHVYQHNQTDWEFLRVRAQRIGYEILAADKKVLFRPVANDGTEALTLTFNNDLLEFHPRLTSALQVDEVSALGWNVKDKKVFVGTSRVGDEVSKMGGQQSGGAIASKAFGAASEKIDFSSLTTQAEADQVARAKLNDAALRLIVGEGLCYGRTDLRAGKVIKLDGIDQRFSGLYYVTATVHSFTLRNGYQTHFNVRRNAS
jgi:phage protein D